MPVSACRRLIFALAVTLLGCESEPQANGGAVATIQPLASIIESVVGYGVEVLLSPGASPHTYDPRPSDVRTASAASALFYGSPTLDGWASRLDAPVRVGLLELVPDSLLLHHSDVAGHADPHFWMDPLTVRSIMPALSDTLCALDAQGCGTYRDRAEEFSDRLTAIHDSLTVFMQDVHGSAILLSHPFLGYFARRYGLNIAGTVEEIPGSEPSLKDVLRMVEQVKETNAKAIFTLPQHPSRVARAISEETGIPVVELDPIGGGSNGYADLLYFNARKIRDALTDNDP